MRQKPPVWRMLDLYSAEDDDQVSPDTQKRVEAFITATEDPESRLVCRIFHELLLDSQRRMQSFDESLKRSRSP